MVAPADETRERDPRLDLLKTIGIALVFLWHLQPIVVTGPLHHAVDFFNWQLSLVAVPLLTAVSLDLFYSRPPSPALLWRRLDRLASVYLSWCVIQFAAVCAITQAVPPWSLEAIYRGGPSFPWSDSVFYFLFNLIVLVLIAFVFAQLNPTARRIVGWLVVAGSLAWFESAIFLRREIRYWSIENFVVYIPIAFALREARAQLVRYKWLFAILFALLALHDQLVWRLLGLFPAGIYGRASIVAGCLALYTWVLGAPVRGSPLVAWVGANTLGLFAIHKYVQYLIFGWSYHARWSSGASHLFDFALVALLTAGCVYILSRTSLRYLVR